MTSFAMLMICLVAQVLIAGGLGIYLLRRFLREKRERQKGPIPSGNPPPPGKK